MSNLYFPYESQWDCGEWESYCSLFTYKIVSQDEFPDWLPTSLTKKFNSALVAASGNTDVKTFLFMGYRVDGDELDEHAYIATYDQVTTEKYAGFIEHADYSGRTETIPSEMLTSMELSGISAEIHLNRHPDSASGTLDDLASQNLLTGFEHSIQTQDKKK